MDPVLIASHAHPQPGDKIVDLGTGCGIIPVLLAHTHPEITITGIEIQKDLADIAKKNMENNRLTTRVSIIMEDIKKLTLSHLDRHADLVITNPPYIKKGCGRINPNLQKAIARQEIMLTLDDLLSAAKRILTPRGRFMIIFPMIRLKEVIKGVKKHGMGPFTIKLIHTKKNTPPKLFIMTAINNSTPLLTIIP